MKIIDFIKKPFKEKRLNKKYSDRNTILPREELIKTWRNISKDSILFINDNSYSEYLYLFIDNITNYFLNLRINNKEIVSEAIILSNKKIESYQLQKENEHPGLQLGWVILNIISYLSIADTLTIKPYDKKGNLINDDIWHMTYGIPLYTFLNKKNYSIKIEIEQNNPKRDGCKSISTLLNILIPTELLQLFGSNMIYSLSQILRGEKPVIDDLNEWKAPKYKNIKSIYSNIENNTLKAEIKRKNQEITNKDNEIVDLKRKLEEQGKVIGIVKKNNHQNIEDKKNEKIPYHSNLLSSINESLKDGTTAAILKSILKKIGIENQSIVDKITQAAIKNNDKACHQLILDLSIIVKTSLYEHMKKVYKKEVVSIIFSKEEQILFHELRRRNQYHRNIIDLIIREFSKRFKDKYQKERKNKKKRTLYTFKDMVYINKKEFLDYFNKGNFKNLGIEDENKFMAESHNAGFHCVTLYLYRKGAAPMPIPYIFLGHTNALGIEFENKIGNSVEFYVRKNNININKLPKTNDGTNRKLNDLTKKLGLLTNETKDIIKNIDIANKESDKKTYDKAIYTYSKYLYENITTGVVNIINNNTEYTKEELDTLIKIREKVEHTGKWGMDEKLFKEYLKHLQENHNDVIKHENHVFIKESEYENLKLRNENPKINNIITIQIGKTKEKYAFVGFEKEYRSNKIMEIKEIKIVS